MGTGHRYIYVLYNPVLCPQYIIVHHHFVTPFGYKLWRFSDLPHTYKATQLCVSRMRSLAWEVLTQKSAHNAFSWHNSLATPTGVKLCLNMSKMYLCLCALPQSWRQRNLLSRKDCMIYAAGGTMHKKSLHTHDWGKHPLWPGNYTACKLETQLQFYHLSLLPPK